MKKFSNFGSSLVMSFFAFALSSFAFAEGKLDHIVKIISEPEGGLIHNLYIETDENGNATHLQGHSDKGRSRFSIEELKKGYVVMAKESGYDAVLIHCGDCTADKGGKVDFKYLHNAISLGAKYRNKEILVVKGPDGWRLETLNRKKIVEGTLKANHILWRVVGISDVIFKTE